MKKLTIAVDEARRTTIGEMETLPNRYFHTFFMQGLKKLQKAAEDSNSPEAKEMGGKAIADALENETGMTI